MAVFLGKKCKPSILFSCFWKVEYSVLNDKYSIGFSGLQYWSISIASPKQTVMPTL